MKNYLLYFFAILLWTVAIPFTPEVLGFEATVKEQEYKPRNVSVKMKSGEIEEMNIEDYVLGVMLCEMPSNYDKQALLAQAVTIRSYVYYLIENRDSNKHSDADLCCDGSCCREYITYKELYGMSGDNIAIDRNAVMKEAVKETEGEIITYNDKAILALYHISSGARTESYQNLNGINVPYLTSVNNVDESGFVYYKKEVFYKFADFENLLKTNGFEYTYSSDEQPVVTQNTSGRCDSIRFGTVMVTGTDMMKMTDLASTNIEISKGKDGYTIRSYGLGSGLGLSQFGANVLAGKGYDYKQIIEFYFKNTLVKKLK